MEGKPRRARTRTVSTFLAGAIFGAASAGAVSAAVALPADPYLPLQVMTEVLGWVQTRYVDDVGVDDLLYDAIQGMVSKLDEHSRFLTPEQYRSLQEDTAGRYYGVGISIRTEGGEVTISRPLPGSPAEKAGIQAGDVIVSVDGLPASGETMDRAVASIKGPRGTEVVLALRRTGWAEPREFRLARAQIHTPSVESAGLPGGFGWVRISHFQERTGEEVKRALAELDRAGSLAGLVLDLRDDPGGLVDEAVVVADEFLEGGTIVSTRGRAVIEETERAHRLGTRSQLPMVVLVNGNSASAAEIVAGALQDQGRAPIMGTTTYGKGSVQTVYEMTDGSALKLTIARYFTPKGRSIHGIGIAPDHWVDASPAGGPEPASSTADPGSPSWVAMDRQVSEAIRYLSAPGAYVAPAASAGPPGTSPSPGEEGAAGPLPPPSR
ncbi:S41 family peptidase [Myxococcota bacterium]|nr:S41 family peptidase [Myxococcota bacterium]